MSQMADLLERDRIRLGFTVGQIAYRLGISPAEYHCLIAGAPITSYDTWERISDLYGWPVAR
ncbi:MAG TPA: helix-turn-helix transcriptional regulator [Actinomycetota bacterium]|nr:helix-turn-helix transcriptional regulator [Actinomycetota bacterium]